MNENTPPMGTEADERMIWERAFNTLALSGYERDLQMLRAARDAIGGTLRRYFALQCGAYAAAAASGLSIIDAFSAHAQASGGSVLRAVCAGAGSALAFHVARKMSAMRRDAGEQLRSADAALGAIDRPDGFLSYLGGLGIHPVLSSPPTPGGAPAP